MESLVRGIEYLLSTSEGLPEKAVHVVFCHKNSSREFVHGVTNEEVLNMMLHRFQVLTEKDNSTENIKAMLFIKQALDCVKKRNVGKQNRNNNRNEVNSAGNVIPLPVKGESTG